MKYLFLFLIVACGGTAAEPEPGRCFFGEQPEPMGWCCEGFCGLTARETEAFGTCTCDGIERPTGHGGRGECIERLTE